MAILRTLGILSIGLVILALVFLVSYRLNTPTKSETESSKLEKSVANLEKDVKSLYQSVYNLEYKLKFEAMQNIKLNSVFILSLHFDEIVDKVKTVGLSDSETILFCLVFSEEIEKYMENNPDGGTLKEVVSNWILHIESEQWEFMR